jgi:hypothetical protein
MVQRGGDCDRTERVMRCRRCPTVSSCGCAVFGASGRLGEVVIKSIKAAKPLAGAGRAPYRTALYLEVLSRLRPSASADSPLSSLTEPWVPRLAPLLFPHSLE